MKTWTASFAGVYRTCLGVPASDLEQAVRTCFASCLGVPAFAYKAKRELPVFEPSIAVIVQRQLDSDVSGVGFSINPLNNDHDEVVISANWGLGDPVVDGRSMADQFVLEKAGGRLVGSVLGDKRIVSAVAPAGGTQGREPGPRGQLCLAPWQLDELVPTLERIECLFGVPVDVEFAYAGQILHILQARPITTHVPLSPAMVSQPGAPRTLYMDIALAKGLTINAPVSAMGQDWLKRTIRSMVGHAAGRVDLPMDQPDGWLYIGSGRMYLNLSRVLWLATPRQLARSNAPTDALLGEALATVDVTRYRSPARPSLWPMLRLLPRMAWKLRRPLWRSLAAFLAPRHAHSQFLARLGKAEQLLCAAPAEGTTLSGLQQRLGAVAAEAIVDVAMPAMVAGVGAMTAMMRLARTDCAIEQRLAAQLVRGLDGNPVVEMNIAMFRLAHMLAPGDFADPEALAARIEQRDIPEPFLAEWQRFMAAYGCRGPGEMDLANPAYRDDPRLLLRQMSFMASSPEEYDPALAHRQLAKQRHDACQALLARFGPLRRPLLKRLYAMTVLFAGTRDTPKHLNLLFRHQVRKLALAAGTELAAAGKLDAAHHVFDLSCADLEAAGGGHGASLRDRRASGNQFGELLARRVESFPALIVSRGRILRAPPRAEAPGQLCGMALSPGVARGRVKCLRNAHGQSIEPGDILVAYTTDPGWTPLFVNAAAIVLEIGGMLQHGALVAREFNKPCVAGIADVFTRLCDGQLVEVDGARGTVTVIDEPPVAARGPAMAASQDASMIPP
ncbi:PEP-utilizing enzyme [Pseudoduganella sp. SL102]|uniref:PEP/pyruvate-binding domain-containing protein n=1 Tax=Pseudoduganella sp. SL102 TaxID=2995154 RepID=UPI00248B088A|nr:PEP/pyruvate-binding domain-containing protein [Pseudoduganella sp. SL102]WBS04734.1 PEP-utilizing enzyme [Pseudoduganella sp. SL102]